MTSWAVWGQPMQIGLSYGRSRNDALSPGLAGAAAGLARAGGWSTRRLLRALAGGRDLRAGIGSAWVVGPSSTMIAIVWTLTLSLCPLPNFLPNNLFDPFSKYSLTILLFRQVIRVDRSFEIEKFSY